MTSESESQLSPLDLARFDSFAIMESADFAITRRSTRSFVESELDANLRELNASDVLTGSEHGTSAPIDFDAARAGVATGTSSSRGSVVSSSASSTYVSSNTTSHDGMEISQAVEGLAMADTVDGNEPTEAAEAVEAGTDDAIPTPPGAPINFGFVMPGIFRSSYPKPENFDFLSDLKLKTIVTLVDKNYTEEYGTFIADNGIQHHMFAMKGTKKENIPLATMEAILNLVLDRSNYPLLIHCNQGRHRTGCVVGIMRAIAGWDRNMVTDEYCAYAGAKVRDCDVDYIRDFELANLDTLLERGDLQIDQLVIDSRVGGPLVGQPPKTTVGHRLPHFFRNTCFSMTVLLIWVVSGAQMPMPNMTPNSPNPSPQ